jgi:Leucine Rich repeat
MPGPRFAKRPLTAEAFVRMAWAPSYRAPRAAEVLNPPPFIPPARPTWADVGAKDLVERDGRVESVSLSGRAFIALAGPLFDSNPPREVRLVAVKWYVGELAACPHLIHVERLNLTGNRIGPAGMQTLAGSPYLRPSLLDMTSNDVGPAGVDALITAPWRHHLRNLRLTGNGLTLGDVDRLRFALPAVAVDTIA